MKRKSIKIMIAVAAFAAAFALSGNAEETTVHAATGEDTVAISENEEQSGGNTETIDGSNDAQQTKDNKAAGKSDTADSTIAETPTEKQEKAGSTNDETLEEEQEKSNSTSDKTLSETPKTDDGEMQENALSETPETDDAMMQEDALTEPSTGNEAASDDVPWDQMTVTQNEYRDGDTVVYSVTFTLEP